MKKPTILLVPGAWHYPDCYASLAARLQSHGYMTKSMALPTVSSNPPQVTDHSIDTEAVRAVLQQLVGSGEEVIIFAHSYASIPVVDALKGLKRSEANGSSGGISHVIHCNGWILHEDESLFDAIVAAGVDPPDWFSVSSDGMLATVNPGRAIDIFYADIDPDLAITYQAKLGLNSAQPFMSKQQYPGWKDFPTTYINSTDDVCVKQETQQRMIDRAPEVTVVKMKGSHCPFLSREGEVVDVIRRTAGESI